MNEPWQYDDAESRFEEVVDRALNEGPQTIALPGEQSVVVVSSAEYAGAQEARDSLVTFFRNSPLRGLDIERARDMPRRVRGR